MKTKVRNGLIFDLEKYYENNNYMNLRIDVLSWGWGFNFYIGDSRRFITINLLCLHFEIWF